MWALSRLAGTRRFAAPVQSTVASLCSIAPAKPSRSLGLRALLAVPVAAFAGWIVSDKDRAVLAIALPTRFVRVVATAASITLGATSVAARGLPRQILPLRLNDCKEGMCAQYICHMCALTPPALRADYKVSLRGLSGAALETQRNACHARGAERLQRLCFANGGVYVKLGQHIAQLVGCAPSLGCAFSSGLCCPCRLQQ